MTRPYSRSAVASFGFERSGLPVVDAVATIARRLWPVKTARQLSARAGVTHRSAEFWLSGQTGMSADALAELLRSDVGLDVLEALMGPAKPSWWPAFSARVRLSQLASDAEDNQRAIEALRARLDGKTTD